MGERLFKNSRLFDIIELDKLEFVGVSYGMDNHICTSDVVYIPK